MNINRWVKGKQQKLFTVIIAGVVVFVALLWYLNKSTGSGAAALMMLPVVKRPPNPT